MLLLKIILLPIRLALSIFTGATQFILESAIITKVFMLASAVFFVGFLAVTWSAIFVRQDMPLIARIVIPCVALLASYVTNPFSGVLKYSQLAMKQLENFNTYLSKI